IYQLSRMAGMFPALVVARNAERAVDAYRACGFNAQDVVVSDRVRDLTEAAQRRRPSVTTSVEAAASLQPLDVFIEATGAVEYGARAALACILHGKHFISLNAETDGTVGCILKRKADDAAIVYSNSDGDQPGVLMRMVEYCRGCGFEVRSAVNCKGFMNIRATPDSIREWAVKQNLSL